jgi:Protein of unknown function (DUF3108)
MDWRPNLAPPSIRAERLGASMVAIYDMRPALPSTIVARLACAWLFGAAVAYAGSAPQSIKATYNGSINGIPIGVVTEHFEATDGAYQVVSDSKTIGIATLLNRQPTHYLSKGQVTPAGLRPALFEGRRSPGEPPQLGASFDWAKGQVTLNHNGKTQSLALPQGTQDRLSAMYQLVFLPLERMKVVEFPMTNGRKLDHYRYQVTPDVEIDTPIGRLKTLHLVKQREGDESAAELWLSVEHQRFPVRLVIIEKNGMRIEQIIQTLEIRR